VHIFYHLISYGFFLSEAILERRDARGPAISAVASQYSCAVAP